MQLNGEERKRFHKSLLSAFPSKPLLKQMVDFELDKNLDAIAMGENHSDTVFELINWARMQDKVKDLLTAARKSNPGNLELQSFEQEMRDKFDENSQPVINTNSSNREIPEENNPTLQTIVDSTRTKPKPQIPKDPLPSEKGVDYTQLRDLLKAGNWKEADKETLAVMLKVANRETEGWLDSDSIKKFPCTDLRTINQLWVVYSNGRFGFSVQKRIWESVGENYKKLGYRVGWRRGMWLDKKWLNYNKLTFCETVPQGYLPLNVWIGRGWELWHGWFDDSVNGLFLLSRKDL